MSLVVVELACHGIHFMISILSCKIEHLEMPLHVRYFQFKTKRIDNRKLHPSLRQYPRRLTYLSIFLLACVTSLESQTTINLTVYATSAFAEHSLVATVLVVQQVVNGRV